MAQQPRILFVTLTNDVGSDRLVSAFGRLGSACAVLGPAGCYAGLSRFAEAVFEVPSHLGAWSGGFHLGSKLAAAIADWQPTWVIPHDEFAANLLRSIAVSRATAPAVRRLLVESLGRPDGFEAACHRVPLMRTAKALGVRVPWFSADLQASGHPPFPLVVKRDHSSGSGGVAIVNSPATMKVALRRLRVRHAVKGALALATGHRRGPAPFLFQQFVEGRLAMHTVACKHGQVLDGISFSAVQVHPVKRAATMLRRIENDEMEHAARLIVAELGCSGFVSFDFLVDCEERATLIEMNPRPIGSAHLGALFGHDLCRALSGMPADAAAPAPLPAEQVIALFPKELERDPQSPCLDRNSGIIHDVPQDEPAVIEAYVDKLALASPANARDLGDRLTQAARRAVDIDAWLPMGQIAH